jgi:hypothetical protein
LAPVPGARSLPEAGRIEHVASSGEEVSRTFDYRFSDRFGFSENAFLLRRRLELLTGLKLLIGSGAAFLDLWIWIQTVHNAVRVKFVALKFGRRHLALWNRKLLRRRTFGIALHATGIEALHLFVFNPIRGEHRVFLRHKEYEENSQCPGFIHLKVIIYLLRHLAESRSPVS